MTQHAADELTIEAARAVLAAHEQAQRDTKNAELRKFVGRFFKYRNSYSSDDGWWLYGRVDEVNEWGRVTGLHFQRTSHDTIEIELHGMFPSFDSSWTEIRAGAFWREAKKLLRTVTKTLERP